MASHKICCGTSNIVLPVPNKSLFPAEFRNKSRLSYYASLFNTVEINSSFYKIPMARTVEKWVNDVPGNFVFSFKLWKGITHIKEAEHDPADLQRFLEAVSPAAGKRGCLLIQFPAGTRADSFARLEQLLLQITSSEAAKGWRLAVEFRHRSWYDDHVYKLIEQYKASVVIHDMPASSTPVLQVDTDFAYIRFHGEKGDYRGTYTDDFLHEYAGYIKDMKREGKTVFVYFNNTIGDAVHNAATLQRYL